MVNKFVRFEEDRWPATLMAITDVYMTYAPGTRGQRNYLLSLMFKPKIERNMNSSLV